MLGGRKSYLGHLLRLDDARMVRRYLRELSPTEAPFIDGSLLSESEYDNTTDMIAAAKNREFWNIYIVDCIFIVVSPFGECYLHDMGL